MRNDKFRPYAAVYLLPIKDNKVLLSRRFNTGYMDGWYSLVAGHIDGNEPATDATIREAREEAGIVVRAKDLTCVHIMDRYSPIQADNIPREYIDFFFTVSTWQGEPTIMEPDKCDELLWVDLNEIPEQTIDYVKHMIECYKNKVFYSEVGWTT
ncbi:MAG: NUDIX domain-containing protein [Patescibacteria group bacterium]